MYHRKTRTAIGNINKMELRRITPEVGWNFIISTSLYLVGSTLIGFTKPIAESIYEE